MRVIEKEDEQHEHGSEEHLEEQALNDAHAGVEEGLDRGLAGNERPDESGSNDAAEDLGEGEECGAERSDGLRDREKRTRQIAVDARAKGMMNALQRGRDRERRQG